MESNKQEESNLLSKNPIAVQAGGSWVSKHMGSPMQMTKGAAGYMKDEDFKGKKPDANGNGVPDYAEDGKGKS